MIKEKGFEDTFWGGGVILLGLFFSPLSPFWFLLVGRWGRCGIAIPLVFLVPFLYAF